MIQQKNILINKSIVVVILKIIVKKLIDKLNKNTDKN